MVSGTQSPCSDQQGTSAVLGKRSVQACPLLAPGVSISPGPVSWSSECALSVLPREEMSKRNTLDYKTGRGVEGLSIGW